MDLLETTVLYLPAKLSCFCALPHCLTAWHIGGT